jgi:mRNA interferase RelE/StbE
VTWKLLYAAEAVRAIRKLDPPVRRRVRAAVESLAEDPWRGKPLQITLQGLRSWRTGDYRIVYRVEAERVVVLILAVGHRREVYDRLRQRLR